MIYAYQSFERLINGTVNVETLYEYVKNQIVVSIDISDLLRWQWVQYVSSFDKFIHDIVRIGMLEIFLGKRAPTPKYKNFTIDLQTYKNMGNDLNSAAVILERYIVLKHSFLAFQDPQKVADALSFIWDEPDKWGKISALMCRDKNDCKTYLKNIVIRRNQIVHEGDCTDNFLTRQDIFQEDVLEIRRYILELGKSIYICVR